MCSSSAGSGKKATGRSVCARPSPIEWRLQKYLAACGIGSRRYCEGLIADGAVRVDGQVVLTPAFKVAPARQRVTVAGRPVFPAPMAYWALHKPAGYVTTCRDPQGRRTFLDLLPRDIGRVYPVGRLDYDSEGLLLATNDGELALRLAHPRYEVEKRYRVLLDRPLDDGALRRLVKGLRIEGVEMRLAEIAPVGGSLFDGPVYEIRLREGRNRQIRRMMEAVGRRVRRLQRTQLGPLRLGSLKPGAARPLTTRELAALRAAAGLERSGKVREDAVDTQPLPCQRKVAHYGRLT